MTAYELGHRAATTKCAIDFGIGRGLNWLGSRALNYGKSFIPRIGERASNVVTRQGTKSIGEGLRSVGSGLLHGVSGGRFSPRGVVADLPFRAGRGVADVFYRHPYALTMGGQQAGVIPDPAAEAIYATAGLGGPSLLDKVFGSLSAYNLGKYLVSGRGEDAAQSEEYANYPAALMTGYEAAVPRYAETYTPSQWQQLYDRAKRTVGRVNTLMPGQAGSRF